jgi:hypothetical protein
VLLAVLVLIQLVPGQRVNPPVEADVAASAPVRAVLRRACYDCHSNETVWPWYSRVAPVSWMLERDVREGRREVNFSTWNRYDAARRVKLARKIWKEVAEGDMPPWVYAVVHGPAKLTEQDRVILRAWTTASGGEPRTASSSVR